MNDVNKEHYFLVYLNTGGGHRAPARAVAASLAERFGDRVEPILIDGLAESPTIIRRMIEDGYRVLQMYARWIYAIIYFYGGPVYASCSCSLAGRNTLVYYFIGLGTLASYLPLYWYRKRIEDRRAPAEEAPPTAAVPAS